MIYSDHSPGIPFRNLDDSADEFSYSPSSTLFETDLSIKQMSSAAFHFPGAPFGAHPPSYSYDDLPLPPTYPSDSAIFDWQTHSDATANAAFGNHAQPQGLFPPHHRALSSSSAASHASDSPYSQPASLPYQGVFDNSQYYEPNYSNYQTSANFLKHNLPTPSHTPTQEGFDLSRRSKTGVRKESGSAAHTAMRQALNRQFATNTDDLPATPRTSIGGEDMDEHMHNNSNASRHVPKLERPMSNFYSQDEMYTPMTATSAPSMTPHPNQQFQMLSPFRNMVNERLQAANQARRSSDGLPRNASPFRQGSPFASNDGQVATAAGARAQQKAEHDAYAYQQHHTAPDAGTPNTISPKDAVLDYHEPEDQPTTSLFPESSQESYSGVGANNYQFHNNRRTSRPNYGGPPSSNFNFVPPSIPASATPQGQSGNDLRFNFHQYSSASHGSMQQEQPPDFPAHLVSMETSHSDGQDAQDSDIERPRQTTADSGTYTCTYHGCTQRFESPAKLQKHKREGHRSAAASSQPGATSDPIQDRNSQAGPHKCERINPSTGKPCNTIFSRPYDLTRHEDTIHNNNKKKVRCQYCTEEKTFSRSDALSRHLRVVHPEVDFPGKHRRRHLD